MRHATSSDACGHPLAIDVEMTCCRQAPAPAVAAARPALAALDVQLAPPAPAQGEVVFPLAILESQVAWAAHDLESTVRRSAVDRCVLHSVFRI
jgi:hypothetical protein